MDLTNDAAAPPTSALHSSSLQASATAAPVTCPDARNRRCAARRRVARLSCARSRRRAARPLRRSLLRASAKTLSTAPPQAG